MTEPTTETEDSRPALMAQLNAQRQAFWADLPVSAETRIDRINRAIGLLVDSQDELCQALKQDFGARSPLMTRFSDIMSAVGHLKHARAHLGRWMKPESRPTRFPMGLMGARAQIEYQPLGVVGVISPWNFPLLLTFGPLAGILAAGNRCMIKPSEHTPETSAALERLIGEVFDADEISVVTGGAEVGKAFSSLPFDHLLFTGATAVGRHVMRAAADNLTPVTLELGGKSPTIIGREADLDDAASKIANGKLLNAGQACLAPDYVFVPEDRVEPFVSALGREYQAMYPDGPDSPDYTAIINDGHHRRLETQLAQIRESGVRTEQFGQPGKNRCLPLTVVIDPPEDTQIMCEEIFGPILPIKPYGEIDEVIAYVQSHQRPLGLYYFGQDRDEMRQVLDRTLAGGVTINDVMFHISVDDLPFGGVGASGMGAYHGIEGFRTFSHAKSVFRQSRVNLMALVGLIPPWGKKLEATLKREIRR